MATILEANRAFQQWIHRTRDPESTLQEQQEAFRKYQQLQAQATAAYTFKVEGRNQLWHDVSNELQEILEEELNTLPTGRQPTRAELERAIQRIEQRTGERLNARFEDLADDIYQEGMEEAASDISGFTPQFGGRHERALEAFVAGRGVADEFQSVSSDVGDIALDIIGDAYREGRVNPSQLVSDIVGETTHEIRPQIQRIVRTETFKIWEQSKHETYREAEERRGEEFEFRWVKHLGPTRKGNPQCDVCTKIVNETQDGVPWDEFVSITVEAATNPDLGGSPKWDPLRKGDVPTPHPNCFTGDMEVLTHEGWKRFDQCRGDETVFTKNLETGENEWEEPEAFIRQEPSTRIHVHVGEPRFAVTATHEMLNDGRTFDYDEDPRYDHCWRRQPLVDLLTREEFRVPGLDTPLNWTRQGPKVETKNIGARDPAEDEKVYCFTVPNGTLYVRHRDGEPFFCGNCRHAHERVVPD